MSDPYQLDRFVAAQAGVIAQVQAELAAGAKRTHWMWFVFPQLAGLGLSPTARRYAISGRAEARAYLDHPVLGPRLRAHTALVNAVQGRSAHDIFGHPDDRKFQSCMTLFRDVAPDEAAFQQALDRYYDGRPDPRTLEILAGA